MDESEARSWFGQRDVPRETMEKLDRFSELVRDEGQRQNLIARSTMDQFWSRHLVDSAQLLDLAPAGRWVDVGTGAGFPGLVIAILDPRPVHLIEPRTRRVDFLRMAVEQLGLASQVEVHHSKAEAHRPAEPCDVVSARAVASLTELLTAAAHLVRSDGTWLLPKGRSAQAELEAARETCQGDFRLVPSITDPESAIVVARKVRPRKS